tara:strand:- start:79 stop:924 length:846 start_codon:yes stop_codon:yes gene_type:complete
VEGHALDERLEYLQYLYDLQGYLVIENVLSSQQVDELNALVDAQELGEPKKENGYRFGAAGGSHGTSPGFLDWGQPFVDLMDHPQVMEVMRMQLGDCFRLDRIFCMRMWKGQPKGRLHSDYGVSEPFSKAQRGQYSHAPAHMAVHGFGVATFNLTDSGPGLGGTRLIPGSHNSHFKLPQRIRNDEVDDVAICPVAPAGSVTFFSEATTHGTAGWHAEHERRTLLYKYCASQLVWSRARVTAPEGLTLTKRQQRLLEEPAGAGWFFDSLFDDEEDEAQAAAD